MIRWHRGGANSLDREFDDGATLVVDYFQYIEDKNTLTRRSRGDRRDCSADRQPFKDAGNRGFDDGWRQKGASVAMRHIRATAAFIEAAVARLIPADDNGRTDAKRASRITSRGTGEGVGL
jgi:hypothetical protein